MDRIFLPFCQFEFSFLRHAFRCSFIVQVGKPGLAAEVSSIRPLFHFQACMKSLRWLDMHVYYLGTMIWVGVRDVGTNALAC